VYTPTTHADRVKVCGRTAAIARPTVISEFFGRVGRGVRRDVWDKLQPCRWWPAVRRGHSRTSSARLRDAYRPVLELTERESLPRRRIPFTNLALETNELLLGAEFRRALSSFPMNLRRYESARRL